MTVTQVNASLCQCSNKPHGNRPRIDHRSKEFFIENKSLSGSACDLSLCQAFPFFIAMFLGKEVYFLKVSLKKAKNFN